MAIGLAVVMGAGPVPPSTAPLPSPATKVVAQKKINATAANLLRMELRWQRRGYRVNVHAEPAFDCAAHSYGQVHDFFVSNDCRYMLRAYGVFRDKRRNVVLVAFSWVEMPTASEASRLKTLVDTGGTGNVLELSRERGRYRRVKYEGLGYDSGIDGRAVWNIQVQPAGWFPALLLDEMRGDVLESAIDGAESL